MGWEAHVTSRDPTFGRGTRSCAIRRGISKKRATAIFDLSLRVGPVSPKASGHVMLRSQKIYPNEHRVETQFLSVFASFATFCSKSLHFLLWRPKTQNPKLKT